MYCTIVFAVDFTVLLCTRVTLVFRTDGNTPIEKEILWTSERQDEISSLN